MFVTNKDEAKAALRSGKVVHGDRAIGKTEALIEVIHEDHKGNAIVVMAMPMHGDIFKSRYRERYPDAPCRELNIHAMLVEARIPPCMRTVWECSEFPIGAT